MSSRTATGRKRMEEPHRITARSLFSRSKSKPPPMPPPVPAAVRVPPLPHTHGRAFDSTEYPQTQTPRPLNVRVDYGGMDGDPFASRSPISPSHSYVPSMQQRSTPSTSLRTPSPATFPMQTPSTIPLATPGGKSYIEVTYQPPPPSSHTVPDPTTFPPPPSYPTPSPSTSSSHFFSSRRSAPNSRAPSRSHSPTPTEPPEYAPLEQPRRPRPALQVTTGAQQPNIRPELLQYQSLNTEVYAEQYNLAEEEQSYLPYAANESQHRAPSFRPSIGGSSPTRSAFAHPQTIPSPTTRRSAVAPSISEGSESSEFSKGPEKLKKGQPGFVYPGSRSNARPKGKSKKDKDSIKSKGSDKSSLNKGSMPNLRSMSSEDAGLQRLRTGLTPMASQTSLSSTRSFPRPFVPDAPPPIPPVPTMVPSISLPPTDATSSTARTARTRAISELNSDLRSVFSDDEDDEPPRRPPQNPTSPPLLPPIPKAPSHPPSAQAQAPAFVFPSSRSRAPPVKPLKIKPLTAAKVPGAPLTPISETGSTEGKVASRFVERFLKKKKSKNSDTATVSSGGQDVHGAKALSANETPVSVATSHQQEHRYNINQATIDMESRELARKIKSRIGSYPLDPYDSILLDNDRHTGELLFRLNPTGSPSFHNYGNVPPTSVLDLGCGQGHWVVDAAIAWKGYGTKVTGYDMVDISKGLMPWAADKGVLENIRFARGNFMKQRLPFADESFDLVRMSCLALCVTSDSWIFVLQEVCRVLTLGGRLELIEDEMFFPFARHSPVFGSNTSLSDLNPPKLDVSIPSASFTTFNVVDVEINNPGLGPSSSEEVSTELYGLYEVDEEEEVEAEEDDDTRTLNGDAHPTPRSQRMGSKSRSRSASRPPNYPYNAHPQGHAHGNSSSSFSQPIRRPPALSQREWNRGYSTSKDIEALFDHMLLHKFGIQPNISEMILGLLKEVFGHAREMKTMHLTLAPEDGGVSNELDERGRTAAGKGSGNISPTTTKNGNGMNRDKQTIGSHTRGLILWPSTFIPMAQSEIEIHASKHLRTLLSCKKLLLEHAMEATEDEEIGEESVQEALWEYESFLRHRLAAPSSASVPDLADIFDDAASIAESTMSDSASALWEIQREFRQRFVWDRSGNHVSTSSRDSSRDPTRRPVAPSQLSNQIQLPASFPAGATPDAYTTTHHIPPIPSNHSHSHSRSGSQSYTYPLNAPLTLSSMTTPGMGAGPSSSGASSSKRNASPASALASGSAGSSSVSVGGMSQGPARSVYAPGGMTHVRTFRIYEAIKIDDGVWGAAH